MYKNWVEFFDVYGKQAIAGVTVEPPMLILNCKEKSMAIRLQQDYPAAASQFIDEKTEVVTFEDGQAAAVFSIKKPKDILKFSQMLVKGNYGTERLVITNGIATPLPVEDRQIFRQSMGVEKIIAFGTQSQVGKETFIWW